MRERHTKHDMPDIVAQAQSPQEPSSSAVLSGAGPLQRPTFVRDVEDGDIILEDAAGPSTTTAEQHHHQQQRISSPFEAGSAPQSDKNTANEAASGATRNGRPPHLDSSRLTLASMKVNLSRDETRSSPNIDKTSSHKVNDNRLGSFRVAVAGESGDDGGRAAASTSENSSASTSNNKPRIAELTPANVQLLAKQNHESGRSSSTERMWRWLADAGPPYEAQPSVGVASSKPAQLPPPVSSVKSGVGGGGVVGGGVSGSGKASRLRLFSCFKCFR